MIGEVMVVIAANPAFREGLVTESSSKYAWLEHHPDRQTERRCPRAHLNWLPCYTTVGCGRKSLLGAARDRKERQGWKAGTQSPRSCCVAIHGSLRLRLLV